MERDFVLHLDNLREGHESVDELLAQDFLNDILVVVVPKGAGELVVVHVGLVLPETPEPRHLLGIEQLELPLGVGPSDYILVLVTQQELQKELPKRDIVDHAVFGFGGGKGVV